MRTFHKYLGIAPSNLKKTDKKMHKAAGAKMLRLNGCPYCKKHVYLPCQKDTHCPRCGKSRYGADGKPLEQVFYFPLRDKFEALLRIPSFRRMINHEALRPSNPNKMSDVYDSPAWKKFMGPPTCPIKRMGGSQFACLLVMFKSLNNCTSCYFVQACFSVSTGFRHFRRTLCR